MFENYHTSVSCPKSLHQELRIRCAKEGITITAAIIDAVSCYLDKMEDQEAASIKSGTGIIGRSKKDPIVFKSSLAKLPANDPLEGDHS